MEAAIQYQAEPTELSVEDMVYHLKTVSDSISLTRLQTQFYRKYAGYILKIARIAFDKDPNGQSLAEDVLQATFVLAFRKLAQFTFPVDATPDMCSKILRAWLGKIANRELLKILCDKKKNRIEYDSDNLPETAYDPEEFCDSLPTVSNSLRQRLQDAMERLSEKERHVILTYASEGCVGTNRKQHISDHALNDLKNCYDTTTDAIKQCKKRALDKLVKYCFQ